MYFPFFFCLFHIFLLLMKQSVFSILTICMTLKKRAAGDASYGSNEAMCPTETPESDSLRARGKRPPKAISSNFLLKRI